MSKRKTSAKPNALLSPSLNAARRKSAEAASDAEAASHWPSSAAVRETVESVVIAFVLAFLFRTFEAEPFVIPTGSMAPTLMGRHKDVECSKCGCRFQAGCSEEVDRAGNPPRDSSGKIIPIHLSTAVCPMCRHRENLEHEPSYNGDRILVNKFAYDIDKPQRWDVIVFKFPGSANDDSRANYIKRLIGLPGETIRIEHGDISVMRDGGSGRKQFEIARKPPEKLLAVLQPVFDNDYMPKIAKFHWPQRWSSESKTAGEWKAGESASFYTTGEDADPSWLRYEHRVPSSEQWAAAERQPNAAPHPPAPQYITDFTAYDTSDIKGPVYSQPSFGDYWVGDLALRCAVELENNKGQLIFELRKGGRKFQCRIDAATGQATLAILGDDMAKFRPTAKTALCGPGRHEILFSNCDNEMLLWVDGKTVTFDAPTQYDSLGNTSPHPTDLAPVGIASAGARARVSHLAVLRDLYYISSKSNPNIPEAASDSGTLAQLKNRFEGPDIRTLDANSLFAMGDNSARSADSRAWGTVPRDLLIGRASILYWPHSWNSPFLYFPNVRRMGIVR